MTDKELADKVVALGVGIVGGALTHAPMYRVPDALGEAWLDAEEFVRDWRVAGALMEKVDYFECKPCPSGKWMVRVSTESMMGVKEAFNESLPRAIIEACVEALT
jgi:hypothetical protein